MRRLLVLVAFAAAAGTIGLSAARADQPVVDTSYSNFAFYPASPDYTYGPGVLCGKPGSAYGTYIRVNDERQRETTFSDGRDLVTGHLTITVGKAVWLNHFNGLTWDHGPIVDSVDLNISGPGWNAVDTAGVLHSTLLLGPTLILVRGFDSHWHYVRQGHVFFLTGRIVVGPGLGDYGWVQTGGTSVDVCDLLGSW